MNVMPARLLHRLTRRHRCRSLLARVEKLLGDFKRAELAVLGKDPVILVRSRWCLWDGRSIGMGRGTKAGREGQGVGQVIAPHSAASEHLLDLFGGRLLRFRALEALHLRVCVCGYAMLYSWGTQSHTLCSSYAN